MCVPQLQEFAGSKGALREKVSAQKKECKTQSRGAEACEDAGIQLIRGGHSGGIRGVFQGHSSPKKGIQDFGGRGTLPKLRVFDTSDKQE